MVHSYQSRDVSTWSEFYNRVHILYTYVHTFTFKSVVSVTVFIAVITGEATLRRFILSHSLKGHSPLCVKVWCQEPEVAGHITSSARKQREMNAGTQLNFPFIFSPRAPAHELVPPTIRLSLLI